MGIGKGGSGPPGKGGDGPPGKGGGRPPGKGMGTSSLGGEAYRSEPERNRTREGQPSGKAPWLTALPLETFLERHRAHLGPPVSNSQPYCRSCRRLEIRGKWLVKGACSLCGAQLVEKPLANQP
jgi:hypothetical protein